MKMTRRTLAASLSAAALAAQAPPQTPASPQLTPDAELQAARDRVKANTVLLSAQQVPMTVEPAFAFKA
jgi:hypothetical protein